MFFKFVSIIVLQQEDKYHGFSALPYIFPPHDSLILPINEVDILIWKTILHSELLIIWIRRYSWICCGKITRILLLVPSKIILSLPPCYSNKIL